MRDYEVTIIIKPDIDDESRSQLIDRVAGWLVAEDSSDENLTVDHWGRRTLAYPIRKYTEGYYVYFEAQIEPVRLAEIERNIQYLDDILRHLVVRKES
ncbi:MAG: 30S ribosomal protein S6 [Candidatus Promineifilaceae bacterium]|nr:30S ribosomal protein S6 [Candidatus Promineifilaceae bacterium]